MGLLIFRRKFVVLVVILAVSVAVVLVLRAALGDSNFLLEKNINVMKLKIMLLNSPCRSP